MIGHGRPASLALALARAALVLCACLVGSSSAQNPPSAEPTQLRITWGGGDPVRWVGRIGVSEGTVSSLKLLEAEPDAVGSIWLEEGQIHVRSLGAHKVDGIEVAAQLGPTAKLQIELAIDDSGSAPRFEIPLADLPRHPYQVQLGDRGNTLEVQIVPPPALRIAASRDPLIFAPGEQCSFELSPVIPNLTPGTDLVIQTTMTPLSPVCRKEASWSDSQRLAVPIDGHPKVVINVPLARTEGVYLVHVSVSRPSGFDKLWTAPTRIATSTRLAERSFQVVVLDSRSAATTTAARWDSVLEIDPTNPRWIERMPSWTQLRRIPGFNHGALGSSYAQVVNLPLGRFVELPPTPPNGDPHWQAYSLPLEAVSVPHMLEIDYPADIEQHFGISIVEPNANGLVSGINRDAGVYVEGLGRSEAKQKQTQRLVFWPRTQAPLLVVSNMHPGAAAHFGQIRVFKRSGDQLSAGLPSNAIAHDRLITAYLARPTVVETFGTARSIDAAGIANLAAENTDDPETSYESAMRLADYLRFSGYNSAIVNINPNGRAHSATTSPLEVDSTELMLRVFDREGISLLPALDFSAPLTDLESQRRKNDAQTSGLEWVGRNGKTWLETYGTHRGLAPYYNLLDPRVQQAILQSVHDTVERYGRHPAFAGLAIQLSSAGYAQLPPLEWGLDDTTFARFAHDKAVPLSDIGPDRFESRYKLLTGQQVAAWRSWRAQQVNGFYTQLAELVRGNSDRRLVLTTENVFADSLLAENMRPNLNAHNAGTRAVSTLIDVGIDREYLERLPRVILCPTRYVEPMASLPDRATDLELNEAFTLWRQPSTPAQSRAAVLYHRPIHQRLSSFEIAGRPWRVAGEMQLACQSLPEGFAVRQPYVEALAEQDPAMIIDGGERLPLGQEDVLRDIRFMFAQLPTSAEVTEVIKQPVVVRTYAEPNQMTVVAMNLSPWRCNTVVTLDVPQATTLERLSIGDTMAVKPVALPAGQQPWTAPLGPYEASVVRIPIAGAKIIDVQIPNAAVNAELTAKLADLNSRDLTAKSDYPALSNPGFESQAGAGRVVGWHLTNNNGTATIQLDPKNPQEGNSSLYFRCNGQSATVESDPFPAPLTGQLAMTVYARGQNLAPGTELQLMIECEREGKPPFQRFARVPAQQMQLPNGQWGLPFAIFASDLPLQSRGQMRIAFVLTGAGEVWLDNVNLHKLLFPLTSSYPNWQADCLHLTQQIHAAKSASEAGQITDCLRIIDGYWPRFILEYCPPNQAMVAQRVAPRDAPPLPPQPNQGQEPSPGFGDRLKRLLPITR